MKTNPSVQPDPSTINSIPMSDVQIHETQKSMNPSPLDTVQHVSHALEFAVVRITPEIARDWLARSGGNRVLARRQLDFLGKQMACQSWVVNGEAIVFDREHRLLNGHHRLTTCVQHNVPFDSVVIIGVDPAAMSTFDQGKVRNRGDIISIHKLAGKNFSAVGRVAGLLLQYSGGMMGSSSLPQKLSNTEIEEVLMCYPHVERSIAFCECLKTLTSPARVAWLHVLASERYPEEADNFVKSLAQGANLEPTSPVLLLRRHLEVVRANKRHGFKEGHENALVVKAWNAFLWNQPMQILKWQERESFPTIRGAESGVAVAIPVVPVPARA